MLLGSVGRFSKIDGLCRDMNLALRVARISVVGHLAQRIAPEGR